MISTWAQCCTYLVTPVLILGGILTVLTHLNGAGCNYYFDHERKYYADHTVLAEYDQIKGINGPSCSCSIDITDVHHDNRNSRNAANVAGLNSYT